MNSGTTELSKKVTECSHSKRRKGDEVSGRQDLNTI
jgi:hypothetical protein